MSAPGSFATCRSRSWSESRRASARSRLTWWSTGASPARRASLCQGKGRARRHSRGGSKLKISGAQASGANRRGFGARRHRPESAHASGRFQCVQGRGRSGVFRAMRARLARGNRRRRSVIQITARNLRLAYVAICHNLAVAELVKRIRKCEPAAKPANFGGAHVFNHGSYMLDRAVARGLPGENRG